MMGFKKATKAQSKARIALIGPSGSGKTYTALNLAKYLGQKVAVIDTERGSASKYADIFDFDVMELETFHPKNYIDGIKEAEACGYDVLIIDSLSHAWMGKDGALELVERAATRMKSGNTFAAWREVTPLHNELVDTMLRCNMHLIVTMRAKTEYIIETNEKGKQVPRKVGMAPIQREGLEFEFDIVADMDLDNNMIISKTRCSALAGGVFNKPGEEVANIIKAWLSDGVPAEQLPKPPQPITQEMVGKIKTEWLRKKLKPQALNFQLKKLYGKTLTELTQDEAQEFLAKLQEMPVPNSQASDPNEKQTEKPAESETTYSYDNSPLSDEEIDEIFAKTDKQTASAIR